MVLADTPAPLPGANPPRAAERRPEDRAAARAGLLSRVDLFTGLDRITLAKIAASLDPVVLGDGQAACVQGEPGDSLHIVSEGTLGVYLASAGGEERRVATLIEGACFGEMALLTGEPRTATVRATGYVETLRLDRARFVDLLRREPTIGLTISAMLSRRLRDANTTISQDQRALEDAVDHQLDALDPEVRLLALRAALLERPHRAVLDALFERRAEEVERALANLGITADNAAAAVPVRRILHAQLARDAGDGGFEEVISAAAGKLAAAGWWDDALALLDTYAARPAFLRALAEMLRAAPAGLSEMRWIDRITEAEAAQDPTLAVAYASRTEATAAPHASVAAEPRARPPRVTARPATLLTIAATVACLVIAALFVRQSTQVAFVLLLGAAVTLWATALLPEFAVGLGLAACWVLFGIATPAQAFGGYGSPSFVAVIAILAVAAAISTSGLLFRVGLLLVRRMPRSLVGQAVTFLVTGILLTPLLPSSTARSALATPLALTAAQSQRLTDRGPAAAVLGLSAYIGANPLLFMFLNGSTSCLLVWGLLPEASRTRFDFTTWFIAALPLALLVSAGAVAMLFAMFRPRSDAAANRAGLDLQLSILGPPTRGEFAMGVILLATIVGWNIGPVVGLHFSVIGVIAFFAVVVARCFTRQTLAALNWDFILGYGVVIALSNLTVSLGLSDAAARAIRDAVGQGGLDPMLVVPALAIVHILVRFLLPMDQALLILSLAFIPAAPVFGMDPWVVIITLLATSTPWFFPAQLPGYQVAYEAAEARLFSHAQARAACAGYMAVTLVALVTCVPYWRALGLVQ